MLKLIAEGKTYPEIAIILDISKHTVDKAATRMHDKLDLHDKVSLTKFAIRTGLSIP